MNCENYMALNEPEQREFLGKAIHAIISTNVGFDSAKDIIEYAEQGGHFNGVKIGNDAFKEDDLS